MSSGKSGHRPKCSLLSVELVGLQAVVEATQKPVEEVALSSSMSIAGQPPPVIVSSTIRVTRCSSTPAWPG